MPLINTHMRDIKHPCAHGTFKIKNLFAVYGVSSFKSVKTNNKNTNLSLMKLNTFTH